MIGQEISARVFRDTKEFYKDFPQDSVARSLVNFAKREAGASILDLGCATGNYCVRLAQLGHEVKGADINPEYLAIARQRGVDARIVEGNKVPWPDKSFDTVLLFEVLEHLPDPEAVLMEAKRLARKNVLMTTPNCGEAEELQRQGLLFEHFADRDHKNFFTRESLAGLLSPLFTDVSVTEGDPLNPLALVGFAPLRFVGKVGAKTGIMPSRFFFRLFAVGRV